MRGFCFTIICSLFVGSSGCNYNIIKNQRAFDEINGKASKPLNELSLIDWTFIKSSVLDSCMNCHAGHTSPELGSLSSVQQNINKIFEELHSNSMPPAREGYTPLSDCKKAIISHWIKLGAPEKTASRVNDILECQTSPGKIGNSDEPLPIESMPLNYQTLLTKIIQPKCIKCHNPDYEDIDAAGMLFFPYNEINRRTRLWAAPGAKSKIIHILTRNDSDVMPPPEAGPRLTSQEIEFIIRWIDAGKPE